MSADKNPLEDAVEQALDAFLYAPIGLFFDGPARFPKLVRNGRTQVTNARMMGQFAVRMGRTEVEKRAKELEKPLTEVLRSVGLVPGAPAAAPTRTSPDSAPSSTPTKTTAEESAEKTTARKSAKKTTAKKTTARKTSGTKKTTKKATKKAATKASTKTAAPAVETLPIPDYDSLSASQVVSRLRGLDDAALDSVRTYETATRGRKTILSKIQQLQKR